MGILSWIVLGLIAGIIAKMLLPGKDPGGCIVTTVIGIVGAVVGGMISTFLGFGGVQSFDLRSMAIAILGAVIFLALIRALRPGGGGGKNR
jgi:uncharacterized membrane protein YeaQ/YmgE (transglycosylase-associated protein family)